MEYADRPAIIVRRILRDREDKWTATGTNVTDKYEYGYVLYL